MGLNTHQSQKIPGSEPQVQPRWTKPLLRVCHFLLPKSFTLVYQLVGLVSSLGCPRHFRPRVPAAEMDSPSFPGCPLQRMAPPPLVRSGQVRSGPESLWTPLSPSPSSPAHQQGLSARPPSRSPHLTTSIQPIFLLLRGRQQSSLSWFSCLYISPPAAHSPCGGQSGPFKTKPRSRGPSCFRLPRPMLVHSTQKKLCMSSCLAHASPSRLIYPNSCSLAFTHAPSSCGLLINPRVQHSGSHLRAFAPADPTSFDFHLAGSCHHSGLGSSATSSRHRPWLP